MMTSRQKRFEMCGFLVCILLLAGHVSSALAETLVCGTYGNTIWTKEQSPYVATCGILVSGGATLTIQPGVTIRFEANKALTVDGTLVARGTDTEKITFTSNVIPPAPGDWGYILFNDSSEDAGYDEHGNYLSGSIMEHVIVEYAGGASVSSNGAVRMNNAHPFINHSTIRNNAASGICGWSLSRNLRITNNLIRNNNSASRGGGIYASMTTGSATMITGNVIRDNTVGSTGDGGGVYVFVNGIDSLTVRGNITTNNTGGTGGGLFIDGAGSNSTVIVSRNVFSANVALTGAASGGGGGVYADSYVGGMTISNNSITANRAKFGPAAALRANYDFNHNTITGNVANGASPTYAVGINSQPLFSWNNIFANTATYELWNHNSHGSANVDATNNWWGTKIELEIQAKIYDYFEDATKGIVVHTPFSTSIRTDAPISPPTGLTAAGSAGRIALNWSPNAESDTAGYKAHWGTAAGYPYDSVSEVLTGTNHSMNGICGGTYFVTLTAVDTGYAPGYDDPLTPVNENQTNGNESWYAPEQMVNVPCPAQSSPALTSPLNNETNVSRTPTLDWNDAPCAVTYDVQVCTDDICASVVQSSSVSASDWAVPASLEPSTTYCWRARSINACTSGSWSSTWCFTTECVVLGAPAARAPIEGTLVSSAPVLDWNDVAGASSYDVEVCGDADCASVVRSAMGVTESFLKVSPPLDQEGVYYWHARAKNDCPAGSWTTSRSFTVVSNPVRLVTQQGLSDFPSIQSAHDAANEGHTIKARAIEFFEDLLFGKGLSVTLDGGCDAGFASCTGFSTVHGSVTVGDGRITAAGLVIQ